VILKVPVSLEWFPQLPTIQGVQDARDIALADPITLKRFRQSIVDLEIMAGLRYDDHARENIRASIRDSILRNFCLCQDAVPEGTSVIVVGKK
jgi:hypothetical protein